jgi:hypothetical protein
MEELNAYGASCNGCGCWHRTRLHIDHFGRANERCRGHRSSRDRKFGREGWALPLQPVASLVQGLVERSLPLIEKAGKRIAAGLPIAAQVMRGKPVICVGLRRRPTNALIEFPLRLITLYDCTVSRAPRTARHSAMLETVSSITAPRR